MKVDPVLFLIGVGIAVMLGAFTMLMLGWKP
jgi:hypothetical protein